MDLNPTGILKTQRLRRFQGVTEIDTDEVAVEEPLEIQVVTGPERTRRNLSITMRTPGDDGSLALGFLFTEGLIRSHSDVVEHGPCGPVVDGRQNTYSIALRPDLDLDPKQWERHFYTTSSCGVCGKSSLEALRATGGYLSSPNEKWTIDEEALQQLPNHLHSKQGLFGQTGAIHATGLFHASGEMIQVCEDVGRHNAMDKVVGWALQNERLPLSQHGLLVSGRLSFELVQKAAMAGIRLVAAIGAPSSLAIQAAEEFSLTLIGFLRDERFNVYTGANRVRLRRAP